MKRLLRLLIVLLVGIGLGVTGYVAWLLLSNPAPREAAGWATLATLPTPRGETAAAVAGGRLYVIGGMAGLGSEPSAEVSVYDPLTDGWQAAPPLPEARHHAAAVGLDGTVYVSGGGTSRGAPDNSLWALPAGADAWLELPTMPEPRFAHRLVAFDGRLYAVGGIGGAAVLIYDLEGGDWSRAADMPASRDHVAAVVVDGEIWAMGGRIEGRSQGRVDIYDPAVDAWREGPPLPVATSGAAETVVGGVIMISGGENPGRAGGVVDAHWQLDTRGGGPTEWEPLPPPPLAVHGAHGAALDGRFHVVGGALRQGAFSRFSWTGFNQAYAPGG